MSEQLNNNIRFETLAKKYLSALLNKDKEQAEKLINDSLNNGTSIQDIYLNVFQPVQWEIGELWQKNKISVAMEHFCTAATQFIMSRLYNYIFNYATNKKKQTLVATSVSGELHELGIRMVTDFFEMDGWNTYYLGASTTNSGVLEMIKECNADLLAISATIYFNIPSAKELISYIKNNLTDARIKIIVGGKAFNMNRNLWSELGADIFARDAQDAIIKANKAFS